MVVLSLNGLNDTVAVHVGSVKDGKENWHGIPLL